VGAVVRRALGVLVAWFARAWLATLRVKVHGAERLAVAAPGDDGGPPRILVFFHGTQLLLQALARNRRTCVMVSHSRDGEMQAAAMRSLGFDVVRGSSSRGGARALRAIVHRLREPATDAVFAVDGPRGPYGSVKPGVVLAASRAGASVIPAGAAARRGWVLERAWDRFVLPRPFTSVHIVIGDPVRDVGELGGEGACEALGRAIAECNRQADALAA
jgi:lysophospholipid acyltransferase (LPLAT)-like uncharacterized protein